MLRATVLMTEIPMRRVDPHESSAVHGWPLTLAEEALEHLARRSGLTTVGSSTDDGADIAAKPDRESAPVDRWIETAADRLGLEVEETEIPHSDVESLVRGCGPALLRLRCAVSSPRESIAKESPTDAGTVDSPATSVLLAVLGCRRGKVELLGRDLIHRRVPVAIVAAWLRHAMEQPVLPRVEALLNRLDVSPRKKQLARQALLRERLRHGRLGGMWLLRLPPGTHFLRQMVEAGLPWELGKFVVFYAMSYGLMLLSWWLLGRGALAGHLSQDWLWAWALVLLSLILPQQLTQWAQAKLAAGTGSLLKRRLLQGALRLEPDEIRHQGAGQLLGRVIESEALQTNALLGGFLAALGVVELVLSSWVLAQGAAGWHHVLQLVLWFGGVLWVGWSFFERRCRWTEDRLSLTNELVENLVGHRTRLAQERKERWHGGEDRLLETYLDSSRRMDERRAWVIVSSYAWVPFAITGLLPAFVAGRASVTSMALAVAGVLLAFRAFNKLSRGFTQLAGAQISWRQAASMFKAAARHDSGPVAGRDIALEQDEAADERGGRRVPFLEGRELVYRYQDRAKPVLDGCDLEIYRGDRILIEGPSGGGKSTLAAILTRLRPPSSGLILLGGLDRHTLTPEVWRRHIVSAPQFHENHVFTETFAFNLLMGRRWPPLRQDMKDAEAVCQELGLGELLQRMPAGLLQLVGETGWQLSHGERSRLFMARALLQGTEIVILDESFAALDPENFHRALHCALARAPTLLVIAHP